MGRPEQGRVTATYNKKCYRTWLMCVYGQSTLTCTLACGIGLLHVVTNTKLSIEHAMDLKRRIVTIKNSNRFVQSKTDTAKV